MNCHEYEPELGDYVDGTLPGDRRAVLSAHIAGCHRCRAIVEDFTTLRGAARTLEPQTPAAPLRMRIAAALAEESRRHGMALAPFATRPWWRLSTGSLAWRPMTAAAVMLLVLAGSAWMAWRQTSVTLATLAVPPSPWPDASTAMESEVLMADQHYSAAIGDLERVTRTESGSLNQETVRVVQVNLEMIDQAIGQSRAALQSEPASTVAQESLFEALRSKLQLLQDTVALINEMRKGNSEGAARIMSGTNP